MTDFNAAFAFARCGSQSPAPRGGGARASVQAASSLVLEAWPWKRSLPLVVAGKLAATTTGALCS